MLGLIAGCGLGLLVLLVAADQLVLGSARAAAWLRVPPTVVGIVVIGFGTSAPELVVSGLAAAGVSLAWRSATSSAPTSPTSRWCWAAPACSARSQRPPRCCAARRR